MATCAAAFSFLTVQIDTVLTPKWERAAGWIWAGGPEGARNVLATIAGSTITVAGTVFSITIVALTLASSQFGPRLLRNFMNDRWTQIVLGVFVSTFLYSVLILRTIRGTDSTSFVPLLSITCGVVFAVTSVFFLIFFIHHVPTSILAENLIGRVARELVENIKEACPTSTTNGPRKTNADFANRLPTDFESTCWPIKAEESGYLQGIDYEGLRTFAVENKGFLKLNRRCGDFVAEGSTLAWFHPTVPLKLEKFHNAFFYGLHRTPTQDLEYSIDQLVEVALRALSPGINDPFTALSCLEWLGVAITHIAKRDLPHGCYEVDQRIVLQTKELLFNGIVDSAFTQIRQSAQSNSFVLVRMLDILERIGLETSRPEDKAKFLEHAKLINQDAQESLGNQSDKQSVLDKFFQTEKSLS